MCAVFHVISQETDLVGHIQTAFGNRIFILATDPDQRVSLNTATINADVFMYRKKIRT